MVNIQKWLTAALIVFFALISTQQIAFAEQLNNSVKDCLQHPEKCQDSNNSAAKQSVSQKDTAGQVGITIWDFVRMILATIFVVALLYFLLKFINKKSRNFKSTQLVENLGGTVLGANRSVQIVKIANRLFIIGVGENVQLLEEIDDPNEREQILSDYNNKLEQLVQPSDIVTKVIEKTKKWQTPKKENAEFTSFFKAQLDELSKGRKKLFEEMEQKGSNKE
ncbi:flagellar biosynthetic protein FliO [Bacillus sp. EB600]|uniref:flagellar biosynthetic protein FliO n=1 Tax=Bacillus sp. EB600 TaxID=2806345 RepID=UPI00210B6EDD|nr:flagellar biosynthetic protein FliO [Bacillus sp. EB600]MCQ6280188.1 flagellar biosynthetic protein FliO [Bacillus sp. EB600]